jgi:hypothetical protein
VSQILCVDTAYTFFFLTCCSCCYFLFACCCYSHRCSFSSLVVGCWLLVVGCWLLVVGCWLLIRVAVISRISFPLQLFLMVLVGPLIVFVNAVFLFTWVSHALVTAELQFLAVDCWFSSLSRPASLFFALFFGWFAL